ncbi:paired domain-containing protein [Trichonephila clavipes]|nr:paired domain-containing protein [Trichonephila clavipes]
MTHKPKEISLDMRKHITELHKEVTSLREIGKIMKLSFTTVGYIVKKYLETGSVESKPRPGGPSKLTSRAKVQSSETPASVTSVVGNGIPRPTCASKSFLVTHQNSRKIRQET